MRLTLYGFVSTDMEILLKRGSDQIPVKPCCYGNGMTTVQATELNVWFFPQTSLKVSVGPFRF